jgi:hypothetical protein
MRHEQFVALLKEIQEDQVKILTSKNAEYAPGNDKLANFKKGADALGVTPAQCLWGYAMKHIISVQDMVNSDMKHDKAKIREKLGDLRNYACLLEALWLEESGESCGYNWGTAND